MTNEEIHAYIDATLAEKIDIIAERAADRAIAKVYEQVGKGLLTKAAWIAGAVFIALLTWLAGKGYVKP